MEQTSTYSEKGIDMNPYYETKSPKVSILHQAPLWIAEYAGRIAYDSFDKSENILVQTKDTEALKHDDIEESELLNQLSWVFHHESVLEHINITFLIEGISRGVLQELARHRIASYTVRSTRYTMSDILYAYIASYGFNDFIGLIPDDHFVLENSDALEVEIINLYSHLDMMVDQIGYNKFIEMVIPKSLINQWNNEIKESKDINERYKFLKQKTKRNVGDEFKFLVTDNWSVDLVMTINLRSLKNFLKLRNSGAAFFQIKMLAEEMLNVLEPQYQQLIWKT